MLKFIAGVLAGVGLGMLIAPAAGSETRQQLVEAAKNPEQAARRKVRQARGQVGEMGARIGRKVAESAADKVIPEGLNEKQA